MNFYTEIQLLNEKQNRINNYKTNSKAVNSEINEMIEKSDLFKSKKEIKKEVLIIGITIFITFSSLFIFL